MTARTGVQLALAVEEELAAYRQARRVKQSDLAWTALERAHILSQPLWRQHLRVHLVMLSMALAQRDIAEVAGQLFRLALAPLGNATGRLPLGNTGRSNVSAFQPMAIPPDLAEAVAAARSPSASNSLHP